MSIQTIFLDVDGVLADFHNSLYASLFIDDPYKNPACLGEYRLEKVIDLPREEILRPCSDEEFWEWIPKTPDADDFIQRAEREVGRENVYFLTASIMSAAAYGGRARWVKEHYPQYFPRLIISPEKHWLAAPGRLLVDDCDDNVNAWRASGGDAILVPRPWNSKYARKQ